MGFSRKIKYGWRRDLPDPRDKLFARFSSMREEQLPSVVNLQGGCPPIFDQQDLGSCTSNAGVSALQFLEIKNNVTEFIPLSRLFVYYNSRVLEHTVDSDAGATIRDTIKSMVNWGACSEDVCPYNTKRFRNKPSRNAYKNGEKHKVKQYLRLRSLLDMKTCLYQGYPFIFGFSVFEGFESDEMAKNGVLNLPLASERYLGGHAVMAVGYNDFDKRFTIQNSWGSNWGQYGFFSMPYSYITDPNLAEDFWTVRMVDGL